VNQDTARWIRNMIGEGDAKDADTTSAAAGGAGAASAGSTRVPSATQARTPVNGKYVLDLLV
jgi:hypothetical protein